METANTVEEKRPQIHTISRKTACTYIAGFLGVLLLIAICISTYNAANIQNEYSSARNEIGDALYSNLSMMIIAYENAGKPGADVEGSILPTMRNYYLAAVALNDAIAHSFGEEYRLLSDGDVAALDAAFTLYDTAFSTGSQTDSAQAHMSDCLVSLQSILSTRFNAQGDLLPNG